MTPTHPTQASVGDRELLEAAAKACGKIPPDFEDNAAFMNGVLMGWNPLTDDGDAFRLAVKLGIHLTNSVIDAWASTITVTEIVPLRDDPCAATRRAIVRVAAAIARATSLHNEASHD